MSISTLFASKRVRFYSLALILLVTVWALSPVIAHKMLHKTLLDQGFQSVEIGSLQIDWLAGQVEIEPLSLEGENHQKLTLSHLKINIDWMAFLQDQILIETLEITQPKLSIDLRAPQTVKVLGWPLPASEADTRQTAESTSSDFLKNWGVGLQSLIIQQADISLLLPSRTDHIRLDKLQLTNALSWHPTGETLLSVKMTHSDASVSIHAKGQPFATPRIVSGQLDIDAFNLKAVESVLPPTLKDILGQASGHIDWQLDALADQIEIEWHAHLDIIDAQIQLNDLTVMNKQFGWVGQGESHIDLERSDLSYLKAKGHIKNEHLKLLSNNRSLLSMKHFQTDWETNGLSQLDLLNTTIAQLALQPVSAESTQEAELWFAESIGVKRVGLKSPNRIEVGEVSGEKWRMNLALNAHQQPKAWQEWLALLSSQLSFTTETPTTSTEKQPADTADKTPMAFRLEHFLLKDSQLAMRMQSVTPPVEKEIAFKVIEIASIDSRSADTPTKLTINALLDGYSSVAVTGQLMPLAEKLNSQLLVKVKGLDLHAFSPLIEPVLAHRIQSGSLTSESTINLKEGILTSEHQLTLKNLSLIESDQVQAGLSSIQLGLNLLRDNQDQIELTIPVKGDVSSPNFELKSVVLKALLKALKGGTKTYLALALQPYGALYLAADYAYQKLGQVVLQPIEFKAGQTIWLDAMPDYLHKVAEMLLNKPQLNLKMCGFYNEQDRQYGQQQGLKGKALEQKMLALANSRQNRVKAWLIEKESISVERLTTCQPAFESLTKTGVFLSI